MKSFLFVSILMVFSASIYGQNNLCSNASPFCTDTVYNFPAGVNAGSAQPGPNYGCLYSQPNPAWYYMEIQNPGNVVINMSSTPAVDIDFILWGPFTNQNTPCTALLTAGNTVDCSYSTSWNETATINNAQTGQVYILLITNYSNNPCNINFHQQNAGQAGAGSSNCGIIAPPISNNGPLCEGETLQLTVNNPNPNATHNWTGPNGFTSNQVSISIPNVNANHAGTYSLTISLNGQTSQPVTTTVVVNPKPTVTLAAFQSVCSDVADFNLNGGSPSGGTYSGQGVSNNQFSPSTVGAGTYPIQYVYETPAGCRDSATANIIVENSPNPVVSNDTAICANTSVMLNASGGTSYNWSNGATTSNITVSPAIQTTYTVTISSGIGCSETAAVVVSIAPTPQLTLKPDNPSICLGENIALVAGGGDNYIWSSMPNDASLGGQINAQLVTVSPNVNTTYTVTATDNSSCSATESIVLSINPRPLAAFYADPKVVSILEPLISFFDNSYGATAWNWFIEDGSTYNVAEFSHIFADTGKFDIMLVVSNNYGCLDSIMGFIIVQPNYTIYIPNTFTPNGDQKNDVFYAQGEGILEIEMFVYDRWGLLVFYSDDINYGWDGKHNGNDVMEGVYFYKLLYKDGMNKKRATSGTVTLIR